MFRYNFSKYVFVVDAVKINIKKWMCYKFQKVQVILNVSKWQMIKQKNNNNFEELKQILITQIILVLFVN